MIVIVGSPVGRVEAGRVVAAGTSARIAIAVAAAGRTVQIVGRVGDDAAADGVLQDLVRAGVEHVAILRDPARPTPVTGDGSDREGPARVGPEASPEIDGADVELALRYLTEFRVIVLVEPATSGVADVVTRATDWGEAELIVATASADEESDVRTRAQVVRRDAGEAEAAFERRVAAIAVTLDGGPTSAT